MVLDVIFSPASSSNAAMHTGAMTCLTLPPRRGRRPTLLPCERGGKRDAGLLFIMIAPDAPSRTPRPSGTASSGHGTCGQPGIRCRRSGFRWASGCGLPSGGSSVRCSRNRRATPTGRGTVRLPDRLKVPAQKNRMAQAPSVRMSGMGHPCPPSLYLLASHRPMAPAVAQSAQAVAEAAHVLLRQVSVRVEQKHETEKKGRCAGLGHCSRDREHSARTSNGGSPANRGPEAHVPGRGGAPARVDFTAENRPRGSSAAA